MNESFQNKPSSENIPNELELSKLDLDLSNDETIRESLDSSAKEEEAHLFILEVQRVAQQKEKERAAAEVRTREEDAKAVQALHEKLGMRSNVIEFKKKAQAEVEIPESTTQENAAQAATSESDRAHLEELYGSLRSKLRSIEQTYHRTFRNLLDAPRDIVDDVEAIGEKVRESLKSDDMAVVEAAGAEVDAFMAKYPEYFTSDENQEQQKKAA